MVCFPVVNFFPAFDCLNRLLFLNRLFLCKYKYLPVKFSRIIRESPGYWLNQIRRLKPNLVAPRGCLKPIFVRSKGLARYVRPKRKFSLYRVVFQSLPSISREIRQFVPSDCLQGNKDDGNHSSPPPPPLQMHGTRVAHKRWLFTRGPTVNRGGSIGRWSHMCVKFLILIPTIVVKFSPDSAPHWTNQTSGF